LDEITLCGETFVAACSRRSEGKDDVETFTISPRDFGLEPRSLDQLRGGGPVENGQLIRDILHGKENVSVARDLVILNAAAALHVAGLAADLREAAALARQSIQSGCAAEKLDALIRETNRQS
jgi:anthranilate phosphoribosyltransferase